MLSTFFQVGQAQDDEYVFNRDHESRTALREDIEKRWDRRRVLCGDQHFLDLAKQNFNGATWQIFLQSEILYRGHKVVPTAGDEPDINVELKGRRCWIEATAALATRKFTSDL